LLTGTTPVALAASTSATNTATGSFSATFATPGLHLIVATYSGDTNFAAQEVIIPVNVQKTSSSTGGGGGWSSGGWGAGYYEYSGGWGFDTSGSGGTTVSPGTLIVESGNSFSIGSSLQVGAGVSPLFGPA
jgi:hypothetical protein